MITITQDTQEYMLAFLEDTKTQQKNIGCIHIHGALLPDEILKVLPQNIGKWLSDPDGKILIADDGDVFVFSQYFGVSVYKKFCQRLSALIRTDLIDPDSIVSFYQTSMNGTALLALAHMRVQEVRKQKEDAEHKRKKSILDTALNPELIASISARRNKRRALCIHIIEDDPFSRRLLNISLSNEFSVSFSDTAVKGIIDYQSLAPDVVFLDIGLPDMNGLDALKKIYSMDPETFVVILSGNGNSENITKAMHIGAKGFIGKPFTREKLLQYILKSPKGKAQKEGA